MSLADDLFLTTTRYLALQGNDLDRKIATHLSLCDFHINETSRFSNRWNCFWAIGHLAVPFHLYDFFTEQVNQRLFEVMDFLYPKDIDTDLESIEITPRLMEAYEGWQEKAFQFLAGEGINNQASFKIPNRRLYTYDGMQFRSKAEEEIMKAFLKRTDCLVFPLPLARCGKIRREPDFLVCMEGKWAILEVVCDYTHDSVVKEARRTGEFQDHLIEIRSFDEKDCRENPGRIVDIFLTWLSRRK